MKMKLTFKEYLESKERLREAIEKTPKQTKEYTVKKYCKLIVGESKEEKEQINLKPKQKIVIEWIYNDINNPTVSKITFDGVCQDIDSNEYNSYWNPKKLQKWLMKNTDENQPF